MKNKLKPRFGDAEGFGLADINIPAKNAITIGETISELEYIYCSREEILPILLSILYPDIELASAPKQ